MTSVSAHVGAAGAALRWIETLWAAPPISLGYITVVPLRSTTSVDPPWLLLDEALAAGSVAIGEISEDGDVPTVRVVKGGAHDVLLIDGQELVGAKQNRVFNTTGLARRGSGRDLA